LKDKKKQKAMYHLKQRKNLESVVQKRIASLETLEILLQKIHSSHTDIEILEAYKVGSQTLSSILGKKELSIDNVEATMDSLQEVLQDQQDIENAMKIGQVEMDDDLEQELNRLVEEEKVNEMTAELEQLVLPVDLPKVESRPTLESSESNPLDESTPLPA
jgi:hypothetical protein